MRKVEGCWSSFGTSFLACRLSSEFKNPLLPSIKIEAIEEEAGLCPTVTLDSGKVFNADHVFSV